MTNPPRRRRTGSAVLAAALGAVIVLGAATSAEARPLGRDDGGAIATAPDEPRSGRRPTDDLKPYEHQFKRSIPARPGPTAARIVQIAERFATGKGRTIARQGENRNMFTKWYGLNSEWCAMFVSYVFHDAGVPLIRDGRGSALALDWGAGRVFANGRPTRFAYGPGARPGDVVWRSNGGRRGHVGIVESVTRTHVYVIEGNGRGDVVTRNSYRLTGKYWMRVIRAPGL